MAAKMTDDEKALWTAVCAAEFVRVLAAYSDGARSYSDRRAETMHAARTVADWAVEAARDCAASDRMKAGARGGRGGE